MRRAVLIALALVVLCGCAGGPRYEVVRIVDGDTLMIRMEGRAERVRLRRLNAPELDEEGGPEAKAALEERFPVGSRVRVQPFARDRWGRLVAEVEAR